MDDFQVDKLWEEWPALYQMNQGRVPDCLGLDHSIPADMSHSPAQLR